MPEAEEYELIAVSPLRRLEKRIEKIETTPGSSTKEFLGDLVDIIKMNQQLVDQLAKANDALRIELSKLPGRLEQLIENLNELISYIKASATEEITQPTSFKPLAEKLDKLVDVNKKLVENNQSMLTALEDMNEKMKRPMLPRRLPPSPTKI